MERHDEEVEKALIFGQDPAERIADLTRQPIKEGSRLTNDLALVQEAQNAIVNARLDAIQFGVPPEDLLQVALAKYAREIKRTGKVMHSLGRKCDAKPD